jgi:hypothetical protein
MQSAEGADRGSGGTYPYRGEVKEIGEAVERIPTGERRRRSGTRWNVSLPARGSDVGAGAVVCGGPVGVTAELRAYRGVVTRAREVSDMSEATANRYLTRLKAAGLICYSGDLY